MGGSGAVLVLDFSGIWYGELTTECDDTKKGKKHGEELLVGFGFGDEKDADGMVSGCSRVGVSVSEIVVRWIGMIPNHLIDSCCTTWDNKNAK